MPNTKQNPFVGIKAMQVSVNSSNMGRHSCLLKAQSAMYSPAVVFTAMCSSCVSFQSGILPRCTDIAVRLPAERAGTRWGMHWHTHACL